MLIKENLIAIDCKHVLRAINIKYNDQLMTTVFYQRFEQKVFFSDTLYRYLVVTVL